MPTRIIAATGPQFTQGQIKTVNVVSGPTGFVPGELKTDTQAQAGSGAPTRMVAPTGTVGLPTICIPGYTGPA
jgi:hypothetical protein